MEDLRERVEAVERALTDGNGELTALAEGAACRRRLVATLETGSIEAIPVRSAGRAWTYRGRAAELFTAAGAFADAVEHGDSRLAGKARRDPLGAAVEATGRVGRVAKLADTAGLAPFGDPQDRDVLEIELETAAIEARSTDVFKPEAGLVNGTASRVRQALGVVGSRVRSRAKSIAKRKAAAIAASLPSGVPVVPAPGLWYAMVNVWHVEVRGSYARFVVGVPRGAPHRLPADFRYVRENATVSLDVDGDGTAERLGWNERIRFEAETVVAVAVPPKPRGVGDVGERDERSAGWPSPGPVEK